MSHKLFKSFAPKVLGVAPQVSKVRPCAITICLTIFSLITFGASVSSGDTTNCPNAICINVYADPTTGKIVISGKKEIAPRPKPPVTSTVRKPSAAPVKPKPAFVGPRYQPKYTPPPTTYRKVTRKPKPKPGVSLANQLAAYLPTGGINSAPLQNPIINLPITFWSTTTHTFQSLVQILGVGVNLNLQASYHWDFGDGNSLTTNTGGAPYPNGSIFHTYQSPGLYQIKLRVTWIGNWIYGGVVNNISGGAITQDYSRTLQVFRAPSNFVE